MTIENVRRVLETRLTELGFPSDRLSPAELAARFGRPALAEDGLHYALELRGVAVAFSVWVVGFNEHGDRVRDALHEGIASLRASGREIVTIANVFEGYFTLRCDLLAKPAATPQDELHAAMTELLTNFWLPATTSQHLVQLMEEDRDVAAAK